MFTVKTFTNCTESESVFQCLHASPDQNITSKHFESPTCSTPCRGWLKPQHKARRILDLHRVSRYRYNNTTLDSLQRWKAGS